VRIWLGWIAHVLTLKCMLNWFFYCAHNTGQ
jgi:hypothetical protein